MDQRDLQARVNVDAISFLSRAEMYCVFNILILHLFELPGARAKASTVFGEAGER
jgi:hypothetical protein